MVSTSGKDDQGGIIMQVNIGESIKALRKRDGRKQEDLAKALGVTVQAVSRWESGGCYPDMNLIPGIANYFHVSIDALFGYNNDRDSRIQEYITKYNRYLIEHDAGTEDLTEIIRMLRSSLDEFPGEPELQRLLALTLISHGCKEKEKPNPYLEEAARILEGLSKENGRVIFSLLDAYCKMGDYEKAEKRAQKQPALEECREILLASINYDENDMLYAGKKKRRYLGETILTLLHELEYFLNLAVSQNEKLRESQAGLDILMQVGRLYEVIFDGDYGKYHSDLCMLYLSGARIAAKVKDYDGAYALFESAFTHYTEHEKDMAECREKGCIEESFQAPLLEETQATHIPIVVCRAEYFKHFLKSLPKQVKTKIMKEPRFAALK